MQDLPVEKLGLSVRSSNCLRRAGICFLSQIMSLCEDDMRKIKNMGEKSILEVLELQMKVKEHPDYDNTLFEIYAQRAESVEVGEVLMIHKAFPHLIGKKIAKIRFRDPNGIVVEDIDIRTLSLSVRTTNALCRTNMFSLSELATKEAAFVSDIKNMGKLSFDELVCYLRDNAEIISEEEKNNDLCERVYKTIAKRCFEECQFFDISFFSKNLSILLMNNRDIIKGALNEELEATLASSEFIDKILKSESLICDFEKYYLSLISSSKKEVNISTIEDSIPSVLKYEGMCLDIVRRLEKQNKIEKYNDGYRIRLPYLREWVESLRDNLKKAVTLRLENKTLEECGNILGLTRERVRQLISKAMRSKPILREDDYSYWYSEYFLDFEAMNMIFDVNEVTYVYYTIAYKQGVKTIDNMYEDLKLTSQIHSRIQKYINRNSILICGEYVPCKRDLLCRKLAQMLCSEDEMSFEEFYDYYLEILSENGLEENEKLLFPSERAFEARLQDSQYVLMKYGRKFRYYPINEYDIVDFVSNLHLEQFKDVEISTLKLYNEYPELMKEFNISDEYELHNLLKKTEKIWNEDARYDVIITRMPFLAFGVVDRAKQTEELLYIVAPVSLEEFAEFYEMEYGVKKQTVMANMTQYISTYYHEGYYSINQPQLSDEEFAYLEKELVEEFYFIDDVKLIYVNKYGDANIDSMNPRTYKELGFKVYRGYLIKSTYLSADEYFTKEFTKNKLLDMNNYDSRLAYIQSSYQALDNLKTNYDLIEYDEKKYISYTHFSSVAENITKDTFNEYVEEAIDIAGEEEFFTIKSLKKKGFDSELHKLGFGDWFNTSLLKNSKRIKYVRTGNGVIFSKQKSQVTTVDFIRYIMNDIRKMDINEFIDYIEDSYGIRYAKDKLVLFIKDSEMYYDSTMEKIYATKDEFYDDF